MKKILSVVIAITMLLGIMIPMGTFAADAVECATWDEVVAAVTADPAAGIKLTADVTANATIASFAGSFDGNGKTVTVTTTMFSTALAGASFKNFTMNGDTTITPFIDHIGEDSATAPITFEGITSNVNTTITTGTAAPFIGYAEKAAIVAMTDCVNNGNLNSKNQAGAFIARTYNNSLTATFINCVNNGDVITTSNYAGGFIGMLDNGKQTITIDGCVNNGTISAAGSDAAGFIGDVAGSSENTVTISNSHNSGKIINNKSANEQEKYSASGFVARFDKGASLTISNCLNTSAEFVSAVGHAAYFCNYMKEGTFTLTNCYYVDVNLGDLHTGALELGEGCQMTAVTADQLASGEVAYNLGAAWGQTIGTDAAPVIGGDLVYKYADGTYSNTEETAPETTAPDTTAPETDAPVVPEDTTAPETDAPIVPEDTTAPETDAPIVPEDTTAPETDAPVVPEDTTAPETDAPVVPEDTTAPETDAPIVPEDTTAPETDAPVVPEDTTAPETDAPVVPDAEVSLKISVWTKNGDWVSADELAAIKAGFEAYLTANGYDISKLNIVWSETTSENNKVAELGAIVNAAGDFDIIVGCGNNVNSTAGVSIIEKADILTSFVAAGRKVATLTDNELATALYTYLTTEAPVTDAPETSAPETSAPETSAPETSAPETDAPATDAPETTAPSKPETGDNSFVIVLAVVAVAAIGCVAINLRKREEN